MLTLTVTLSLLAGEPFRSGLQVGEAVPQFYVRAITGPLKGKSVCYVCRNGDRPVVMVLARKPDGELKKLLKELDGVVDRHRADGLRCFGVFVGEDGRELAPQIQTLGFDEKLSIPLTLGPYWSEAEPRGRRDRCVVSGHDGGGELRLSGGRVAGGRPVDDRLAD